jgi:hypothetical protein
MLSCALATEPSAVAAMAARNAAESKTPENFFILDPPADDRAVETCSPDQAEHDTARISS